MSKADRQATATCPSCRKALPVTKFPTRRTAEGPYERDLSECRSCEKVRRAVQRGAACPVCKQVKAITTFPTVRTAEGTTRRALDECRACREVRRAAKRRPG